MTKNIPWYRLRCVAFDHIAPMKKSDLMQYCREPSSKEAKKMYILLLKLRHYEKATKFEKISHLFWQNSCFYSVVSKQVGDFFKFLWPSQKSWTLPKLNFTNVYYCNYQKMSNSSNHLHTKSYHFFKSFHPAACFFTKINEKKYNLLVATYMCFSPKKQTSLSNGLAQCSTKSFNF